MNIRKAHKEDYAELMRIWESAVKATHDFLSNDDFEYYKQQLPVAYFPQVALFVIEDKNVIKGFLGVAENSLEMLFIDDEDRGKGYGKKLARFAIDELDVRKVDVNEQNKQATGFYEKIGFVKFGRSALDAEGKNYPVLHFELADLSK